MKPSNTSRGGGGNQGEGDRLWARRGPKSRTRVSVEELIEKGHTVVDRVKPYVQRATAKLRSRFGRH